MTTRTDPDKSFSVRLRQHRLARGLSLQALAELIGGLVTKQALSKYERGAAHPSLPVLAALARAFGVKTAEILRVPEVRIEILAFRKTAALGRKVEQRIVNQVSQRLEERVRLQRLTGCDPTDIPVHGLKVASVEQAETAAEALRTRWRLGNDPLASMTDVLESHHVHIVEVDAAERFDGLAAVAMAADGKITAAAVVSKSGLPGERQRMNLAHELGHLVLKPHAGVDGEKVAFRFAGALLAPAATLRCDVGTRRSSVEVKELLLLKRRYGMSMQALVYRLGDLGVISQAQSKSWWQLFNAQGWKKREPGELDAERPQWLKRTVLRAIAEGLLSAEDAGMLTGEWAEHETKPSLSGRRALLQLPLAERRRLMVAQAERLADHYDEDEEWRTLIGGDIVDD